MEALSRRHLLRLGGAAGATGTAALLGGELAAEAYAPGPRVRARLTRTVVRSGERLTLHVVEDLKRSRIIRVVDSTGLAWKQVKKTRRSQVWTARTATPGTGLLTVVTTRRDGRVITRQVGYQVEGTTVLPTRGALIGMSADPWDQRVAEVGSGLGARRIFADLGNGPTTQIRLVEEAHAAGLLPVISYKVPDVAAAVAGQYNAVADQAAARLASYGLPTAVTFWHEPHTDMAPSQYVAASQQILPVFKRGELRVGPLLNGWLLDNQQATFGSYCPDEMFAIWDWMGIDTYQDGSLAAPGPHLPGDRVYALSAYVKARGFDLPLGVGEYNAYSAAAIAHCGEALLTTPNVWFGCVWNNTGGIGVVLTGDRLAAFRQTVADPRAGDPRVV